MTFDETPGQPDAPEGGGPVHYQISITGRQAGAFFFLLLLVLGLAFFFGMKTGAAARKGPDAVTRIAGASDLPVPTIAAEEKGEKAEPAPEPAEKKLGFEEPASASATPASPTPTPAPTAAPEPTKAPQKTARAAEKREKPAAAEKPAGKAWHVQVLATKDGKKADDWVKKLKREGFKADVATSPKNAELFVVRVGPYADKAKAEAQRKRILRSNPGLKGLMVVPS